MSPTNKELAEMARNSARFGQPAYGDFLRLLADRLDPLTKGEPMAATRIYEVPVTLPGVAIEEAGRKVSFLVEAKSGPAAERHVAKKYVGEAILPNGKRIAELMGGAHPVKVEEAKEDGQ